MKPLAAILLFSFSFALAQQRPDWIDPAARASAYPSSTHLVGFSSQYFTTSEDLNEVKEKVKSLARSALSETLLIQITSTSNALLQNSNGEAQEEYTKSVVTGSSLRAVGLQTEVYVDHRKQIVYGLAQLPRGKLAASYFQELTTQLAEIKDALAQASGISDKARAYSMYLEIVRKLNELKSIQGTLRVLGATNDVVLRTADWKTYYLAATDGADKLRDSEEITFAEAAHFLTDKLIQELDNKSATIVMGLVTYKNTGVGSELSERLRLLMIEKFREKNIAVSQSMNRGGVQYFLSGSYWPGADKIQISATIEEHHDAEVVRLMAGGSIFISSESLSNEGIDYSPADIKKATEVRLELEKDQVGDIGMSAEIWTNKVGQNQIYREGDILTLSVRVNQPAYLRLINVWNDGSKLLLLDNYYLDSSKTNKIVELPFQWQTTCPCGVEYLQLMAQNEEFVSLETRKEGDFVYIEESLRSAMKKSRGVGNNKVEGDYFSEKKLTVTTLKK